MKRQVSCRYRCKIDTIRFILRAASTFLFQRPKTLTRSANYSNGLMRLPPARGSSSSPTISVFPAEDHIKLRSKKTEEYEMQLEPGSPEVSCIGQIQTRRKNKNKNKKKGDAIITNTAEKYSLMPRKKKTYKPMLSFGVRDKKKSATYESFDDQGRLSIADESHIAVQSSPSSSSSAPSLGQIKRFSSGRSVLSDFDWTTDHDDINHL